MLEQQKIITKLVTEIDLYLSACDHAGVTQAREGITHWFSAATQHVEPATLPPCSNLGEALVCLLNRSLASAIEAAVPFLKWETYDAYPRADVGEAFADNHAFASLIGETAFFPANDFDLGLFVIAPNVLYPDHHHAAPELYVPLTGPHAWRFHPNQEFQWIDADIPVWNEPWKPHATLTGNLPFLCIYCWTKDVNQTAKIIISNEAIKD